MLLTCFNLMGCISWISVFVVSIFTLHIFCNLRYFNGGPPDEVDYGCVVSHFFYICCRCMSLDVLAIVVLLRLTFLHVINHAELGTHFYIGSTYNV